MSKLGTLLGLAVLGGGVYYLVSRKEDVAGPSEVMPDENGNCPQGYHRMFDADTGVMSCMRDDDPSMAY